MPRFDFDTSDGQSFQPDDEGQDLNGIEVARMQAQAGLTDMARDVVRGDGSERPMVVQVRDEVGNTAPRAALVLRVEIGP